MLGGSWDEGSFRGVPFLVEERAGEGGRRGELHEFPQRDVPYFEDLGRAARAWSFTAFVIGSDYGEQRDALLAALEEEGPGTLYHPELGEVQAAARRFSYAETRDAGGKCTFTLSFVEAGENLYPSDEQDTVGGVESAVQDARTAFADAFEQVFSVLDVVQEVFEGAEQAVGAVIGAIQDANSLALGFVEGFAAGFVEDLASSLALNAAETARDGALGGAIVDLVRDTADAWAGLVAVRDLQAPEARRRTGTATDDSRRRAILALQSVVEQLDEPPWTASPTPTRERIGINAAAIRAAARRSAVVEMARLAARTDFPSYDDAAGLRDRLTALLDGEIDRAAEPSGPLGADDTAFLTLQAVRAATVTDLTARGATKARLIAYRQAAPRSSLALAWRLYRDVGRTGELVARNRVPHPAFVPPEGEALSF